ncbi:peptide-methionine (S)-S-oxide reductase [Sphingomonas guangdongensis]|uniref:peptide-methionine (S)-S-oxide reductase n=1 Tax=Sphingomonas guangdongensis TaxID=1141890 RepID=A0A285R0M9_9SPHN|nr:peptide-methionine (S)-S-oxide reductase [Sphingomonas guangdongensis]SOB87693.1 peptide-methionine (S)-S-oxide reductase [Sphingomonas guangdongensis]
MTVERIGLGGGCHWCTEGVFQALKGVDQVDQGFLSSTSPWDAWSEGVVAHFDPAAISLATLVEVHLRTHSGSGTYSPGGRYRSAVYIFDATQSTVAREVIAAVAAERDEAPRTLVLPLAGFQASEERYRNYYRTDPDRPFCRRYIDPKLDYLRRQFADLTRP